MDVDLIQVVNRLQDTFSAIGGDSVDLPQCVVVGAQSSGKSSVLETIVGRDFLPRGQGIVTRRPLILQLVHTPSPTASVSSSTTSASEPSLQPNPSSHPTDSSSGPSYTEWGEFLHLDKRFTDFSEIRREIENETFRVAGQNKGVSKLPIHLKIHSPHVLNLTLVDLPGLTKIPVGDQPTDIERQIRGLVTDFISKPNCVILAVSPANVDLANSDSLKLARSVDPQGRRTIGVLTKLDLMDAGTHALDILTGRVYPLKLGFIGVVNRSQQDINGNVSMLDARKNEEEFFRTHPAYRNIAHRCGTKFLAKTLNQVLMNHIREKLPDMKARLNTLMGQTQQELAAFGDTAFMGEQHRGSLVLKLMTQFARDFIASIDGNSPEISTKELSGGARIYYIFNDVFGHALDSINPTANLTTQDIRTSIRNSTGPRPSLFVPEAAFDLLIKPQIKLLEAPSLRCVELVYEELMKICHNCTSNELQRFPRLHAQLIEVVSELLRERLGPTSEYVQSLIAIQAAYINTNHPAFVAGSATFSQEMNTRNNRARIEHGRASFEEDANDLDSAGSLEEDDETLSSSAATLNGVPSSSPREMRQSVSSSAHGRRVSSARSEHGTSLGKRRGMAEHDEEIHRPVSSLGLAGGAGGAHGGSNGGGVGNGARDTFLNYFFGGGGPGAGGPGAPAPRPGVGGGGRQGHLLPEIAIGGEGASSGVVGGRVAGADGGRRGYDGTSAAYDMKSLEKHLEATPLGADEYGMSQREELETSLIRSLIATYFGIVRQSIQDIVPKAIMHLLVNFSRESVQNRLVAGLYKEDLFEELLYEDEGLVSERKRVKALLDAYKEAFNVLSEVTFKPT